MGATNLIALLGALAAPMPPANQCRAETIATLPVTMANLQPMVDAWSLYMRGLVEATSGEDAQARADRAAAIAIDAKVADRAKKYGIEG